MSSAFERSLRGAPSSTSSETSSSKTAEVRKKKSVRWNDTDMASRQTLCGGRVSEGVLQVSSGPNASLGPIKEQSIDHLRVPSTRPTSAIARADTARIHDHHGATSSSSNFVRKRTGERSIQAGAVRVRTPAKPKRPRPGGTPSTAALVASSSGQQESEAFGGRATPRNYLRRTGVAGPVVSPKAASSTRRPRPAGDSTAIVLPGASSRISPPLRTSPRFAKPQISSTQALRNVAGGNDQADEPLDGNDVERDDASTTSEVSPMSLLSTTLSSIGIVGTGSKPPRSPKANALQNASASPRGASELPRAAAAGGSPRTGGPLGARAAASSSPEHGFYSGGAGVRETVDDEQEEEDDQDDEPLPRVTRQSLESRLAAASLSLAASRRTSMDTSNNVSLQGSPFTKSTTVRRKSTSMVHVNGEASSFVSEEVSEESSITVNASCGCQHDHDCAVGSIGGHLQPPCENGSSIEVRDRLEELQGRNSTLEQEKVNLTMALVPLEERLQSKERAWESERRELIIRMEDSLRGAKVAEDRCRELEKRRSEMEEERHALDAELRRLRREIEQRESKTAESFWQRTVAADREKTRLETELDQAQARVTTLTNEKSELEAEMMPLQSEAASLRFRANEADKVASRVLTAEEGRRFSEAQLEVMQTEFAATSAQLTAVQTELAQQKAGARKQLEEKERKAGDAVFSLTKEMQRLQEAICSQADRVVAASMSAQKEKEGGSEEAMLTTPDKGAALVSSEAARIRQQEVSTLKTELDAEKERTRTLQKLVEEGEDDRRRMHNTIQDLRGSVRVYVRARPFLKSDGENASDQSAPVVRCGADDCSVAVIPPEAPNRAIACAFDHVFGGHASQEDVFEQVSGFVQSALDGFKVCLFSYGQTGSGKTHTMTGSGTGMMRGIVPRAVEHILARVGELQDGPWSYGLQASFMEIYNEELKDLLLGHDDGRRVGKTSSAAASPSPKKLGIKIAAGGGTEVVGLTKYTIDTDNQEQGLMELEEIMGVAQRARSVACTAMNAQSSRSHSVFTLWLTGVDASTGTTLKGVLHLVDLAGSERLDRSGAASDARRLKETQSINKSLSCLADVFSALSAKASHIPFRNSKLTYLMQDCLSGDGKALMFVNLSPTAASANETVCSLRFANQVSQVELGKATRQMSLNKPAASRTGRAPSSGTSPTRSQGSRLARASGSGASGASTAPPSPRTSTDGTGRGGGSFGFGRSSVSGRRTSTSGTVASPKRPRRGAAAGSGVTGRPRLSSNSITGPPSPKTLGRISTTRTGTRSSQAASSNPRMKGTAARGTLGTSTAGAAGKSGGRASSASGSRLAYPARSRPGSVDGQGRKAVARAEVGPPGTRKSFSGSRRPSSAISRVNEGLPYSPKPGTIEKRPRLSADEDM